MSERLPSTSIYLPHIMSCNAISYHMHVSTCERKDLSHRLLYALSQISNKVNKNSHEPLSPYFPSASERSRRDKYHSIPFLCLTIPPFSTHALPTSDRIR